MVIILIAVGGFLASVLDDEANEPERPPEKPRLEDAVIHVTGDDGGDYRVSYTIWTPRGDVFREEQATAVIEAEPHAYRINLDGFESDQNPFFLGTEDIDIDAAKRGKWVGDLTVVLEVNGKLVECLTIDSTDPEFSEASMTFDADTPEEYEADFGCRLNLWLF